MMITFAGKKSCLPVADKIATENKNLIGCFLFEHALSLKHRVLLLVPTSSDQTVMF